MLQLLDAGRKKADVILETWRFVDNDLATQITMVS